MAVVSAVGGAIRLRRGLRVELRCTPVVCPPVADEIGHLWLRVKAGPLRAYVNGVRVPYRFARWFTRRLA